MWMFNDGAEQYWIEEEANLRLVAECCFRIYKADDMYFLDAGDPDDDIFESRWIPLYNARNPKMDDSETA